MPHTRIFDGTEAGGGYARAVRAGAMVFVAGTTSLRPDGTAVGADVYTQTVATYDKIEAALEKAGARLSDVVRVTAYITDMAAADGFIRAQTERFGETEVPTAALIGGIELLIPELLIEIEATAIIDGAA
ncbi:MAG: Rid family hydrolase [Pseudomonadota bacterium]